MASTSSPAPSSPVKTPCYTISKYFCKSVGKKRHAPPLQADYTTPLTSAAASKRRKEEIAALRSSSPLSTLPPERPIPFVLDEGDDDDDDDVEFQASQVVEVIDDANTNPEDPLYEVATQRDPDDDDLRSIEEMEVEKPPEGKTLVFVEDKEEFSYVNGRTDKRPREEYLAKPVWTKEEIEEFLREKLELNTLDIMSVIELSKDIYYLVQRLTAELEAYHAGWISRVTFVSNNCFDYKRLRESLFALYDVEKKPPQFLVMFFVPGSPVKFTAADVPAWMNLNDKQMSARQRFCLSDRPLKRVLYWANQTTKTHEPIRVFGDNRPVDITMNDPVIERCDNIYTVFMERFWELERLFTLPEFM